MCGADIYLRVTLAALLTAQKMQRRPVFMHILTELGPFQGVQWNENGIRPSRHHAEGSHRCRRVGPALACIPKVGLQSLPTGLRERSNQDVSIPRTPEPDDTYAYNLSEVKAMLAVLPEPAWTVVLTAAFSGLSKGEIRGLRWTDFNGKELTVNRIVWNSVTNEPKTKNRRAPVPAVKLLADALEAHKLRMHKLAAGPIFQAGNGEPLNLENLVNRVIKPALSRCAVCRKREDEQ
jgi:integrase